jgi:dTDP-4-amino-4,6-dideoxygalactose transaminase
VLDDIASQSLAVLLRTDVANAAERRRANEARLRARLQAGRPLRAYALDEVPLAHLRLFDSRRERDATRARLAARSIYTSIQWVPHPAIRAAGEAATSALDWADRHLAFPVGEHLTTAQMDTIADAANAA